MLIRWLLFGTTVGQWLLLLLERMVGLAVVEADLLANQRSGVPLAESTEV